MDWKKKEYWLVLCFISFAAFYSHIIRNQRTQTPRIVNFTKIPNEIGDWVGEEFFFDQNVLDELKADKSTLRRYVNSSGDEIWLFIGYWSNQKYGAQPHSPLHCLPGSGWNIVSKELISLDIQTNGNASNHHNEVNFATIKNGKKEEAMLFWYQTRSGNLSREFAVKLDLAKNSLLRNPTDAAFIRLTTPILEHNQKATIQMLHRGPGYF